MDVTSAAFIVDTCMGPSARSARLVSVVIPTHNRRHFICETVNSVLGQTYTDLEILVVDDGSSDGTAELLARRYFGNPRFHCIRQQNAERAVARNTGIKAARGEFIAFLDSDDLWAPNKLERQMAEFVANPGLSMVYCGYLETDESGSVIRDMTGRVAREVASGNVFATMLSINLVGSPTPVIRRSVFSQVGMFNENRAILCFEDWEMWTRASYAGPVAYVAEPLAMHRIHAGNTEKPFPLHTYAVCVQRILRMVAKRDRSRVRACAMRYCAEALDQSVGDGGGRREVRYVLGCAVRSVGLGALAATPEGRMLTMEVLRALLRST